MSNITAMRAVTPGIYTETIALGIAAEKEADFSAVLADTISEHTDETEAAAPHDLLAADYDDPAHDITTAAARNTAVPATDYSSLIADTLREEAARMSITSGAALTGVPNDFAAFSSSGLEEIILTAASTGEISGAQTALFMLCMMMQSDQGGDFSMMMQMMSSMLTKIEGDKEKLRQDVMLSNYDPYVLDTIDKNVFNTVMPGGGTGQTVLPTECWKPTTPAVTSNVGDRSPQLYRTVINQFRVETAQRYKPGENTYCNIFVWDVTSAMGAEVPHYIDAATGEARYYPDISGATAMGAIATDDWLSKHGSRYGWFEADAETAQRYANAGKPAITSAGALGHVQVVAPSKDGTFDSDRGVAIAQAGRIVSNYTHLSNIYGNSGQKSVRYWVHD